MLLVIVPFIVASEMIALPPGDSVQSLAGGIQQALQIYPATVL